MLYYMNSDTGKVIAREIGDEPFGDLWFEISEDEYQEALHPLSPANTGLQADNCPRCAGRGEVRNDGFVWVACPVCDGAGIAAKA